MKVSTSILSVDENAAKTFYNLEVAKTDYFHIDVMDGIFVEKNTHKKMKDYATTLKHITNIPLDVHLMVYDIKTYIDEYIDLEPDFITFHIEATKSKEEVFEIINYLKENNIKAGISIKPNTSVEEIYEYLPYIHLLLVMTVEPGKGGQELIESTIEKINTLNEYIVKNELDVEIEVDGGINDKTCEKVKNAGATILVSGSYIINSDNFSEKISLLKK